MTNIQTHYEHAHKTESEVKTIRDLKIKITEANKDEQIVLKDKLNQTMTLLRNHGNNVHNTKVCKQKKGEIILV